MSPKNMKRLFLVIAAGFFGFSLFHVNWLAPTPSGGPTLLATVPVDIPRDINGCIIETETGYGAEKLSAETRMLQYAVGSGAQAIIINSEIIDGKPVLPRRYDFNCPADNARPRAHLGEALTEISKPIQFIHVTGAQHAKLILASLPANDVKHIFFGDQAGITEIKRKITGADTFIISDALSCMHQYRGSGWYGAVPQICRDGTILLMLDDLGYTLWGWPNRFLDRMKNANVRVIIARKMDGDTITGLTDVDQYGDIASSYNGIIMVENIDELGRALKR